MALKDTLEALRRSDEAPGMSGDQIKALIQEWRTSVDMLLADIHSLLAPLEADGIITVEMGEKEIQEADLGFYGIQEMTIAAGVRRVSASPIGRLVAGATGRVDLIRDGHLNQMERVMLLRKSRDNSEEWVIETRGFDLSPDGKSKNYHRHINFRRNFEPLSQGTLESGIEYLMQL